MYHLVERPDTLLNSGSLLHSANHMLECPRCGKYALVTHERTIYQCIACDFRKDISRPHGSQRALLAVLTLIGVVLLL